MRIMDYTQFLETLEYDEPVVNWPDGLRALWYDAIGDWEASHNIAQDLHTDLGSWIHAYLHRKEGDEFNAEYWYSRANRSVPTITLDEELKQMVEFVILGI